MEGEYVVYNSLCVSANAFFVQLVSFTNVYDAATNVYPYRTEQTKIDPRNIECGDIVIAEGRIVCKERALPGWRADMELVNLYLVEKMQTRVLIDSLAPGYD